MEIPERRPDNVNTTDCDFYIKVMVILMLILLLISIPILIVVGTVILCMEYLRLL